MRTFDSFVMNRIQRSYDILWIDEGLMVHPGLVNFVVNMSHCKQCFIFGDRFQIPFINRVMNFSIPDHLAKLCYDDIESRNMTKRCPLDVTKLLNDIYGRAITSTSRVRRSMAATVIPGKARFALEKDRIGDRKILTFTQDDKDYLTKLGYDSVQTVHEVQGETYEHVALIRCTPTPVTIIAKNSPHVTVALSRHTMSLHYYTVVNDVVATDIAQLQSFNDFLLEMYQTVHPFK